MSPPARDRADRRDRCDQARRRRRRGLAGIAVVAAVIVAVSIVSLGRRSASGEATGSTTVAPATATVRTAAAHRPAVPLVLGARVVASLPAPGQDAAPAPVADGLLLLGGLTSSDISSPAITLATRSRARPVGTLPHALHDAAATTLGRAAYLFGGGDGVGQLDGIERIDPVTGAVAAVGRLPAPSSDSAAAAVGGTAYIVGGYTGAAWLDTIVAWRPGQKATVVGHLPTPLRYAAVTAVGNTVVIAGGSTPSGAASAAVYAFEAPGGPVRRVGRLPAGTTHAAAAAYRGVAFVIGGRGGSVGTPTAAVERVDLARGRVVPAGSLDVPLSDLAAGPVSGGILVAGGRGSAGTVAGIRLLHLVPALAAQGSVPPLLRANNVYAADAPNRIAAIARNDPPRIYVPNSKSNTVDVIDPRTFRIVEHFAVGGLPQHVTPSYDLRTLYVLNDAGNSLTPIDPRTTKPGTPIPVEDPYNMYFTPDGRYAIVVAERLHRLDFRDPHTMRLVHSVSVPCSGVDHMDFSADGSYLIASCEFSGQVVKVDLASQTVIGTLTLGGPSDMPQDVKLSPDGRVFYVADMMANGLWEVDGATLTRIGFLPTGKGAHGLYPSRDARLLYVSNRNAGTVSVVSFATRHVVRTWTIPNGTPDMGGVSADGSTLWLSGRYSGEVYAIDTRTGKLRARIRVGAGPHGLSVWPQPGRYSLGHTGIMR